MIGDLATAASENVGKFIIGARPMDQWEDFIDSLKAMHIEDCIAIKQQAYDRYLAR